MRCETTSRAKMLPWSRRLKIFISLQWASLVARARHPLKHPLKIETKMMLLKVSQPKKMLSMLLDLPEEEKPNRHSQKSTLSSSQACTSRQPCLKPKHRQLSSLNKLKRIRRTLRMHLRVHPKEVLRPSTLLIKSVDQHKMSNLSSLPLLFLISSLQMFKNNLEVLHQELCQGKA